MRPGERVAARRYARALLDVAVQQGDPEAVRRELREATALMAAQAELRSALLNPAVPGEAKRKVVEAVWGRRASPLTARLMALLAERGRIGLLGAIEDSFGGLWNAHRGVVAAQAVAAVPLDEAQTGALAETLRRATGKEVELKVRTEAALQGGLVVTMAGRTYDGSVRGRLKSLRARLVEQAANS